MQVFPTRSTVHLALAASAALGMAIALRLPAVVGWAAAMLGSLAAARAATQLAILRLRRAGLEMVWQTSSRVHRVPRASELEIFAELKNRDTRPVRFSALRVLASRELQATCEPTSGEIAPGSSITVVTRTRTPRVGNHCLQGMAVEVRAARGSFEVPLSFANPLGVQVLPRALVTRALPGAGSRSQPRAEPGSPHPRPGPGSELHDLREHVPGDAFKHIAWKASARRGRLMVREYQREDREVVWLVVDAAVEHAAGPLGQAPLDAGIDEIAALAKAHLRRGDHVGIAVSGADPVNWVSPAASSAQARKIAHALTLATSTSDAERSEDDEADVARKVLDHLRFLDARSVADVRPDQLDALQAHAELKRPRAPYDLPLPQASSGRERALRRYLACFGIASPPRIDRDRSRAAALLVQALVRAAQEKPRPSLVYVWSPASELSPALPAAIARLRRRAISVRWLSPPIEQPRIDDTDELSQLIRGAVITRAQIGSERGEQHLRAMGAYVRPRSRGRLTAGGGRRARAR